MSYPPFEITNTEAVTPSDSADLGAVRALYIGGAGNVAILADGDSAPTTHTAVPVGTVLWVRARRVYSTNTTATNIVAWY